MTIKCTQVERLRIKDEEEEEARTQLKLQASKVTILCCSGVQCSILFWIIEKYLRGIKGCLSTIQRVSKIYALTIHLFQSILIKICEGVV